MGLSDSEKIKLRALIRKLEKIRGRHTELVSVYIPAGYNLNKVMEHLFQERGTAENIKSTTTRKNVIDALERMMQHLKLFKETPKNGLAVFSGNISDVEGRPDIEVFSIEPPEPIKVRIYRCDKEFVLNPLKDMLREKDTYGLIVIDKREATIGVIRGKRIITLGKAKSAVPGKTKAGGQCLTKDTEVVLFDGSRVNITYLQVGDELLSLNINGKIKRKQKGVITDYWTVKKQEYLIIRSGKHYLKCSLDHLVFVSRGSLIEAIPARDLIIGDEIVVLEGGRRIKRNIDSIEKIDGVIDMVDISVDTQCFFANDILVHNSAHRFERVREGLTKDFYREVGELVKKFFYDQPLKGIILGGPGPTKQDFLEKAELPGSIKEKIIAIKDTSYTDEFGLQELVEKSKDVLQEEEIEEEKTLMNEFLSLLAKNPMKVVYGEEETLHHLKNGAVEKLLVSEILGEEKIEELMDIAEQNGTKLVVISTATREGMQLKELGGYGAILRYRL